MNGSQLDQLPYLCLKKIFEFLGLRDLVKCRAVNRQFKFYADQAAAKVDELIVNQNNALCGENSARCYNWYLTDRPINFDNSFGPNAFSSLRSSPFKFDKQLKFLHIHLDRIIPDFEILNEHLKQLVHLEMSFWPSNGGLKTLNLPNLKTLYLGAHVHGSYVLKTPMLQVLRCAQVEQLQFECPERIKQLNCKHKSENHLAKFKNLEELILDLEFNELDLGGIHLSDWPNLKELRLWLFFGWASRAEYEAFKSSLANLMHQRAGWSGKKPKIYFDEVLLCDPKQLLDFEEMLGYQELVDFENNPEIWDDQLRNRSELLERVTTDAKMGFLFKNYRQLRHDTYPQVTKLHFNVLMNLVEFELSEDFFDRFPRLGVLEVSGSVHREDLEWFLERATEVVGLILRNTSLDQSFMDSLPKISSQLTWLSVEDSFDLIADFNFILRFKELQSFKTDWKLDSLELAANAFQQSNKLLNLQFRAGNELADICRLSLAKGEYMLTFYTIEGSREGTRTFGPVDLNWTELATLYDQRRAAPVAGPEKKIKIKRMRLE